MFRPQGRSVGHSLRCLCIGPSLELLLRDIDHLTREVVVSEENVHIRRAFVWHTNCLSNLLQEKALLFGQRRCLFGYREVVGTMCWIETEGHTQICLQNEAKVLSAADDFVVNDSCFHLFFRRGLACGL